MTGIDPLTFRRLGRLVKPFFATSEVRLQARAMLGLLVLFSLSIAGINYLLSYRNSDIFTALQLRDRDGFYRNLVIYVFALAATTPVTVFYTYTEQRLALLWRLWLSRLLLGKYFSNLAYYKVGSAEGIDNPDQRLEEDIRTFTAMTLSLFLIFCNSALNSVIFIWILWNISSYLVVAAISYAIVGSVITYFIGRPMVSLNFSQLKKEADYRYKLVSVRDNSELIAFYRGQKKEQTRTRQKLKQALQNFLKIIHVQRNLGLFITLYNNLKPVVPIAISAPLFLNGEVGLGVVTQSADAFVRVVEALSVLITNFNNISNVAAVVTRLGSFAEALDDAGEVPSSKGEQIKILTKPHIAFHHVTIRPPRQKHDLSRDLSFQLEKGGMLITGGSGNGKTSILRVISGLWTEGSGTVERPDLTQTIFLPQRPYIVLGSLRNQLHYAPSKKIVSDHELKAVMRKVGLETTFERIGNLNAVLDWKSILSVGEQQQLAFARLLLAKPRYAFLDEATTAVDANIEAKLYSLVQEVTTAFISVGYRANLARYHHTILELQNDGTWKLEKT